jgi:hypothetical protein
MMKSIFAALLLAAAPLAAARELAPAISGDYLEVRTCHVYTGPCLANGEMGLAGKEGILVWKIREGHWKGTSLNGLSVIAVVQADRTLGDLQYQPVAGKVALIIDSKANPEQEMALEEFAKSMAGGLIGELVAVETADLQVSMSACAQSSCAKIKADGLVEISTQCMSGKTHLCGNEETYYPPLSQLESAHLAYTEVASYTGDALAVNWTSRNIPSAFIGQFSR